MPIGENAVKLSHLVYRRRLLSGVLIVTCGRYKNDFPGGMKDSFLAVHGGQGGPWKDKSELVLVICGVVGHGNDLKLCPPLPLSDLSQPPQV